VASPNSTAETAPNLPRPRVLWVGESARLCTGFGRVADELTRGLAATGRYELGVLGWQAEPENGVGYTAFPAGREPWSADRLNRVMEQFAPEMVVTSGPLAALAAMTHAPLRHFIYWIGHATFEAAPLVPEAAATLGAMDQVVVPSAWCKRVADEHVPAPGARLVRLGVDPEVFRPLPDRDAIRERAGLAGRFVVGCVARSNFRKQIPLLVRALGDLARDHPEAFLYLHTDPDEDWNLTEVVRRHGLSERTAFTRGVAGATGVDSTTLNTIYNLFDVMVLPTMGEAFGLPILEAMAAGVPVIATDCSAVPELLDGRGELVRVKEWITMPWDNADYALLDVDDLVAKLRELYHDRDLRQQYAQGGRAFALTMTWDRCAAEWAALIDGAVSAHRAGGVPADPRFRAVSLDAVADR